MYIHLPAYLPVKTNKCCCLIPYLICARMYAHLPTIRHMHTIELIPINLLLRKVTHPKYVVQLLG
jgi:hypothetical protein